MAHTYTESKRTYSMVLGALLVLTVITVLAAGINFGAPSVNVVVALAIASVKGTLVVLFFMHLKDDHPVNAVIFSTGLAMLAIFLIFCFDRRGYAYTSSPQRTLLPLRGRRRRWNPIHPPRKRERPSRFPFDSGIPGTINQAAPLCLLPLA